MTEIHEQVRLLLGRKAWEAMKDNECIISTNMRRRKADGGIYANEKKPEDSGVAVYFMYQGNMRVVACDKWLTVKENLHAIAKTLEAMRGIDRWGASDMLNRMFTGFIGIPEEAGKDWYTVLGLSPKATEEEIKRAYRDKMKKIHPDIGGSDEAAAELTEAYKKAMKTVVDG
jgi:DnaJ-domain-containing protein 1